MKHLGLGTMSCGLCGLEQIAVNERRGGEPLLFYHFRSILICPCNKVILSQGFFFFKVA
ncbi:hypothetical protein TC_0395 [Chlamydia muridarum str. Nigg]|uniref:Uncharacterized protein n=1 Tax=Chlamydia muridarum (strain MoPn / Nigg) TaxID=243161 RepID=Q9PKR9_CHLMU|nr:hypothetical protein TC_0395 [Chlamydia muridarum str. Nigg]